MLLHLKGFGMSRFMALLIHDFGGFPEALYRMRYPAKGDPALATRVVELLGSDLASASLDCGLDHGTWSVLCHLRPKADCPVVQLRIDDEASVDQPARAVKPWPGAPLLRLDRIVFRS
ncbi:MAG: hypothetical protein JJE39_01445 [Vicinamibacteria bacterium]|nr:hypothetical protein [Vicinamibacteria bacterium]